MCITETIMIEHHILNLFTVQHYHHVQFIYTHRYNQLIVIVLTKHESASYQCGLGFSSEYKDKGVSINFIEKNGLYVIFITDI